MRRYNTCRFPGLAISNAKIIIYFSNKIYGSDFIKRNGTRKLLWFENTKMPIVGKKLLRQSYSKRRHFFTERIANVWTHCLLMLTFPHCPGLNNLLSKSIFHSLCSVISYNHLVRFRLQYIFYIFMPSVLWCCWLGGRKGIRPVKNGVVGCWHGYLSGARCRLAYGPADATATHCLLLQWYPDWFYLSGTSSQDSPGKRAVKWVCVCVCVCVFKVSINFTKD